MKIRLKKRPDFILPNVSDDFPLTEDGQWEKVLEYVPFSREEAMFIFQQDHTGVTQREDGIFYADESAMEKAKKLKRI